MRTAKNINKNINILRWTIPALFAIISVFYQLVIAKYVYDNYGHDLHWIIEIAFYGTVGPLFTFWIITRIGRWLGENRRTRRGMLTYLSFGKPTDLPPNRLP